MSLQINTHCRRHNAHQLPQVRDLAGLTGADALDTFLLVEHDHHSQLVEIR